MSDGAAAAAYSAFTFEPNPKWQVPISTCLQWRDDGACCDVDAQGLLDKLAAAYGAMHWRTHGLAHGWRRASLVTRVWATVLHQAAWTSYTNLTFAHDDQDRVSYCCAARR